MKLSGNDLTECKEWEAEQERRLLGFEVLRAFVLSGGGLKEMDPGVIADKTLSDKGHCHRILQKLAKNEHLKKKLFHGAD